MCASENTEQNDTLKEIKLYEIGDFKIGNAQDKETGTGCTVLLFEDGACAGLDVRGGGPAARESELLKPMAAADMIHAILLSGGSAFGLDAAGGVMQYLEERGCGTDVGGIKVPLVCESCLFDLSVGDPTVRPDKAMGYAAACAAEQGNYHNGNFGAGTGATVGKTRGMQYCMKSGIGSYAVQLGSLKIGAVVAVNALGDIFDYKTGHKIAGVQGDTDPVAEDDLYDGYTCAAASPLENTTIGVVITNARFNKSQLCKIASTAQDGLARSIRPVHTNYDGDSIYAVSLGDLSADQDVVATLAARVVSQAILCAVQSARSAYGIKGVDHEA